MSPFRTSTGSFARPYGTLLRAKLKQNAAEVSAIAAREGVGGLIIGLPLDGDQKFGPRAQAARDWAHAMAAATGLPAALQDESFTTADAHEHMIAADISRARRAEIIDKLAAAGILQAAGCDAEVAEGLRRWGLRPQLFCVSRENEPG